MLNDISAVLVVYLLLLWVTSGYPGHVAKRLAFCSVVAVVTVILLKIIIGLTLGIIIAAVIHAIL